MDKASGQQHRKFRVDPANAGERLDRVAAYDLDISRTAVQRLIAGGNLLLDGAPVSPSLKVRGGEEITAVIPSEELVPEDIPVPVVYEDGDIVVVDKPAGLVVHPGAGNQTGTLVNALLSRGISGGDDPVRPGIVHRLDRDTSGLLVVAKSEAAYERLVAMLSERDVTRRYRAVVVGTGLPSTGSIDSPVGRDPENPTLMAAGIGKSAVTHFEKMSESHGHTMLKVRLETGRMHQIRVHMSAIEYPVYGDPLYGAAIEGARLWLHAEHLAFVHPVTGEAVEFDSDIPDDLAQSAAGMGFSD